MFFFLANIAMLLAVLGSINCSKLEVQLSGCKSIIIIFFVLGYINKYVACIFVQTKDTNHN